MPGERLLGAFFNAGFGTESAPPRTGELKRREPGPDAEIHHARHLDPLVIKEFYGIRKRSAF